MRHRAIAAAVLGLVAALAVALASTAARALGKEPKGDETVSQYLTPAILTAIFPEADRTGEVTGSPPAAPVYKGDKQLGFLFSSWDVTRSKGFSNRPLVLLVGLDLMGRIAGVRLVHHEEPIAILGLKDEAFHAFTANYRGHDINQGVDVVSELSSSVLGPGSFSQRSAPGAGGSARIDAVSRATTSAVLMSDAIVRGARILARSRGILAAPANGKARLDVDLFASADWPALEAAGALAHLHLSYAEVRAKLKETGAVKVADGDPAALPDDPFLDLYVALATPAGIGVNLLGETWYGQYTAGRGIEDQLLLIAANGRYSFLEYDWEHAETIGRIEIAKGERTIKLSSKQIKTLPFLHAKNAPPLTERALVFFSRGSELDPSQPFRLRLLVSGETAANEKTFALYELPYGVPEAYLLRPAVAPGPPAEEAAAGTATPDSAMPWQSIWAAHRARIVILGIGLATLTAILFLQDAISRRPRLHRWVRIGFLGWTLVWLGWYAGAQLTVVNLLTYIHTLVTDFRWDYVLADPLVTILSAFTLAGLFLWGRAVFCGWLCPFGALQELANKAAQRLGLRQFAIPAALHERLVAVKYLLFLGLLAASFLSWDLEMTGAEIEPFKAAIILRFMTEWPMVVYAVALVAASLVVERFYCLFGCPLGGGLAILGRVRMFDWLKRHPECGFRCHLCESVCPVGAIKPSGVINMNECFYCLDCQVTYYDDHVCPPMVWRRRRRQPRQTPAAATLKQASR